MNRWPPFSEPFTLTFPSALKLIGKQGSPASPPRYQGADKASPRRGRPPYLLQDTPSHRSSFSCSEFIWVCRTGLETYAFPVFPAFLRPCRIKLFFGTTYTGLSKQSPLRNFSRNRNKLSSFVRYQISSLIHADLMSGTKIPLENEWWCCFNAVPILLCVGYQRDEQWIIANLPWNGIKNIIQLYKNYRLWRIRIC